MDTVRKYRRLALDCLQMAEAAQDPATREDMTRLAHLWARLAETGAQKCIASGRSRSRCMSNLRWAEIGFEGCRNGRTAPADSRDGAIKRPVTQVTALHGFRAS